MFNPLKSLQLLRSFFAGCFTLSALILNKFTRKNRKSILFIPHTNCLHDNYDILNGKSSNVLCLLDNILKDSYYNGYKLYVVYYHKGKEQPYIDYCKNYHPERVCFVYYDNQWKVAKAVAKCFTVFTDSDWTRIQYRVNSQRLVCLNYFGGLIKNELYRFEQHGGFKRYLKEQKMMFRLYDYHLSISDMCSKFIAVDNCHYYPHFISLGFPRNDIFFNDNTELRRQVEISVDFPVKRIITYAPTHRDYENHTREFYDMSKSVERSIWGHVSHAELDALEKTLADTQTLIIAKVHPIQKGESNNISSDTTSHVIFYEDLVKKINTSLNPLLAISDSIITDYTTTVYDFLYLDRPIIYYFYDIEEYRATRGFFIEPIESICAGYVTYDLSQLQSAIRDLDLGKDIAKQKRKFLQELFIKELDGNSCDRIKKFFFKE